MKIITSTGIIMRVKALLVLLAYSYYNSQLHSSNNGSSLLSLSTVSVEAQPLPNDNCTGAIPFTLGSTVIINFQNATVEPNYTNDCDIRKARRYQRGVWYTIRGTGESFLLNSYNSSARKTGHGDYLPRSIVANVFTGGCMSETQKCASYLGYLFDTVPGTTYHILVQFIQYNEFEPIRDVSLTIAPINPSSNVNCTNARPYTIGSRMYNDVRNSSYKSELAQFYSPCTTGFLGSFSSYKGIWFTFVGSGDDLVIQSCLSGETSITIFSGGCPSSLTASKCFAGNTEICHRSAFGISTTNGTTYHALVLINYLLVEPIDFYIYPQSLLPNDKCVNATIFPIGSTITLNTTYATLDYNLSRSGSYYYYAPGPGPGVWYTFVGTGGLFFLQACDNVVSIFTNSCPPSGQPVTATTFNLCTTGFNTISGTRYYVLLQSVAYELQLTIKDLGTGTSSND